MSRVITVSHCADCPHNERNWVDEDIYADWCNLSRRPIELTDGGAIPQWCPLPESKEESNAKG